MPIFIKKFLFNLNIIKNKADSLSFIFLDILINILYLKENNNDTLEISKFLNHFGEKYPRYSGYAQNDALKFLRIFLEEINKDLNIIKNKRSYREFIYDDNKTILDNIDRFNNFSLEFFLRI